MIWGSEKGAERVQGLWFFGSGLWLILFLFSGAADSAEHLDVSRPNLVVVLIDDHGWGDLSCFGNTEVSTPHIDRLAREGLRFTQFYVNAPICSPSRCALMTGQYPQRWRITSFLSNRADNRRRGVVDWLDPSAPTLARQLSRTGYAVGHFGKWHLGGQRDVDNAPTITQYGFDESLTNFEGMGAKLLPLTLKPGQQEPGRIWADAERLGQPVTWMLRSEITGGFVNAAISFIDQSRQLKKPFCINVWPDDVHSPFWPPVEAWSESKRGLYLAVLQSMDRQLGRLFDYIRSDPELLRNTVIVLCSDNGPEPGAGSAGPFRGAKTQLYEGGIRSPLIVWAPGFMEPARVGTINESSVFAAFDLVPSLLSLAGTKFEPPVTPDGEDLSATLLGREERSRTAAIFWRRPPDRKNAPPDLMEPQPDLAVREGQWKLLCNYDGSGRQLYDLLEDRAETHNLAEQLPELSERLSGMVLEWHRSMPADRGPELGAEVLRRLQDRSR